MKLFLTCLPYRPPTALGPSDLPRATGARPNDPDKPRLPERPVQPGHADLKPWSLPRPQTHLVMAWKAQGGQARLLGRPYAGYAQLAAATRDYFDLPSEDKLARDPATLRESGYARIDQARERLFVRSALPDDHPLGAVLDEFRAFCASLARECLIDLAVAFGMAPASWLELVDFAPGSAKEPSENIIRVFRYAPAPDATEEAPVLTAAHRDLGILAIGLRSAPGLEGYLPHRGWVALERPGEEAAPLLMAGRSLALLSRRGVDSCEHRVVAPPGERFSWVYHLRLRRDVVLNAAALRSMQLPPLYDELCGLRGGELTARIYASTHNVNAAAPASRPAAQTYDQQLFAKYTRAARPA